jgi:hypothetical protein
MKLSSAWALLIAGVLGAACAAACSATPNQTQFSGSSGNGASNNGGSGSGAGTSTSTGIGGGISFGDGGPNDAAPDHQVGPTTCDASCSAAGGTCMQGTCVVTYNPGNVDPTTQGKLKAGGTADPAFAWLYPYDQTVFPRGLLPPTLQFAGADPTAVFVHVSFPGMDYQGWYGASSPARVVFAQAVWKAITLAATPTVSVKVDVTKISGTAVTGPVTENWTIAPGSLRGTIYYETYDSAMQTAISGLGGVGIMKIQPGASMPQVVKSGCGNVCHTASADGSTLVAATSLLGSASWDLTNNANLIVAGQGDSLIYGGIYPDGSFVVSATDYRTWLQNPSRLYDAKTGANIPTPSWDNLIVLSGTPAFSPDGKQLAFNHKDTGGGHTLGVMNYDHGTNTFSGLHDVASDPTRTLAWPAFTPDGKWVVFHAGSDQSFETDNGATGDLYFTSAGGPMVTRLDSLDGYKSGMQGTYLPQNDPNLSFAPTVLPEAVGGYFWVVFTSHRGYGNTAPSMAGGGLSGADGWGKLWVAAFDINAMPGKDPSHPAFYLDGQELAADNLRGFWVLDPCKQTSNACTSGDECCTGFCRSEDGGPTECVPPPGGCSMEFEKCAKDSDCCDPSYSCINGHCAQPAAK